MENNFYSMDKLVEFGMSMAIANQMTTSMNNAIREMNSSGVRKNNINGNDVVYYVALDGRQAGPYSLTELARLIGEKRVVKETYIWKPGMDKWEMVENVEEVLRLVALTPPPIPKG